MWRAAKHTRCAREFRLLSALWAAGLPVPRHAEGGFIPRMFANARRELWPTHARDLLYQRYHYAKTLIEYGSGEPLTVRMRR